MNRYEVGAKTLMRVRETGGGRREMWHYTWHPIRRPCRLPLGVNYLHGAECGPGPSDTLGDTFCLSIYTKTGKFWSATNLTTNVLIMHMALPMCSVTT
jgi:hypothetical protein